MSKMGNQSRIRKQFGAILDQKAGELIRFQAIQGDGTGTVKVPGKPNYIYIRRLGRNLCEECLNAKLPSRNDLPTIVGYTAANPGTLEVLGVDWTAVTEPGDYAYAPHHHQAHELGNEYGGDDVVWVQKQQVLPLLCRPTDPVSMFVVVLDDWYPWESGWNYFEGATSADLTGHIPVLLGEARFVLISIDGATNALQYTSGTEFIVGLPLADIDERVPAPPLGSVPVCAVYIAGTTTSLGWENLYDLRLFNAPVGGSLMPGVHDHSSDAEGGLLPATSVEVEEVGVATYDDVQDWLNDTQSAGRLSGGAVTAHAYPITGVTVGGAGAGEFKVDGDHTAAFTAGIILTVSDSTNNDGDYTVSAGGATFAGGVTTIPVDEAVAAVADGNIAAGTVDVALGTGLIKVADAHLAATRFFDWAATTVPLIPTNNASNWIYADYNGGAPIIGITDDRSIITRNDIFTIDRLWRIDSELHIIGKGQNAYNLSTRTHRNLVRMFHFQRGNGLMLTESGLRKIDVTAGNMYRGLNEIPTSHIDTDDGDSFTTLYRDGGGGWTWVTGQTTVDNVNYDDGTGVLEPLVNNQYGVYWAYLDYDSHLYIQYGQDSYRLGEAEVAQPPTTAPFLSSFSMLIAKIVVKEGAAENFYSVEYPWDTVFVGAPVAVHNNLGGLQGGTADERYHLTAAEHGAIVGGAGAANQIAYWSDASTIVSDAGLTYDPATDSLTIAGHMAVGAAAAVSTTRILVVEENITANAGWIYGVRTSLNYQPTANFNATLRAVHGQVQLSTAHTQTGGALVGVYGQAAITTGVDARDVSLIGGQFATIVEDAGSGGGVGATVAAGISIYTPYVDTGIATMGYGVRIVKGTLGAVAAGNRVTTLYGLHIADLTDAKIGTCYSIYCAGGDSYHAGSMEFDGHLAIGFGTTINAGRAINSNLVADSASDTGVYNQLSTIANINTAGEVFANWNRMVFNTAITALGGARAFMNNVRFEAGGTGSAGIVYGGYNYLYASGGATNATLFAAGYFRTWCLAGWTGTITTNYGILIWPLTTAGGGTITTNYGLYIGDQSAGGTNYAIYSAGGDSYHAGKWGIGTTAALELLDIEKATGSGGALSPVRARLATTHNGSWAVGDAYASLDFASDDVSGSWVGGETRARMAAIIESDIYGAYTGLAFYTSSGDASLDEAMRIDNTGRVRVGPVGTSPSAQLHVDNPSVAQPVLYLDQGDVSEEMIEFATTIGVGNAIEAVGGKTLTTTHFIKITLPGALTRYLPVGTIA